MIQMRLFRYRQRKTLLLMLKNRTFNSKGCSEDPIRKIPCFASQENIITGRTATSCCGGARLKACVAKSFGSRIM